ncbi:MAG: hypothetical protein IH944_13765 [Armatimonadetes bacterium]|nr:hypothetical protein [Armatimonadota bacterium]
MPGEEDYQSLTLEVTDLMEHVMDDVEPEVKHVKLGGLTVTVSHYLTDELTLLWVGLGDDDDAMLYSLKDANGNEITDPAIARKLNK